MALSEQLVSHLEEVVSSVTVDRQALEQSVAHALASLARVRIHRNDFGYLVSLLLDLAAFSRSRLAHNRRWRGHVETVRDWSRYVTLVSWTAETVDFGLDTARHRRRAGLLQANDFTTWKEMIFSQ